MQIILVLFVNGLSLNFFIMGQKLNFIFVWNEASRKKKKNPPPGVFPEEPLYSLAAIALMHEKKSY